MKKQDFRNLQHGDVVRNKLDRGHGYIVHCNYGGRVTAVRTADLTNPDEWELVEKCTYTHMSELESKK